MNNLELEWSTGLTDCQTSPIIAFIGFIPFGCCFLQSFAVAEATLQPVLPRFLLGLAPGFGCGLNRQLIRERYRIRGDYWTDCLTSVGFCLSTAQEYREVYKRESRMRPSAFKDRTQ